MGCRWRGNTVRVLDLPKVPVSRPRLEEHSARGWLGRRSVDPAEAGSEHQEDGPLEGEER